MWPRLITQLLELLPHVSRLVPVADKYFSTKSASERAQEAALAALAGELRTGVEGLGGAQAGLERQLNAQALELASVRATIKDSQAILASQENRLAAIELGIRTLKLWGTLAMFLVVALLVAVILITVHAAR